MRFTWVRRDPTVLETEFVGPEWGLDTAVRHGSNLKERSGRVTVCGHVRFPDLPSPEERIFESIHTSQRKVEQSVLGTLVPILPVIPERAIGVVGSVRLDAIQIETAIVDAVAVLSGNGDTEGSLPCKSWSISLQRNDKLMVAHNVFISTPQDVQAIAGQTPPI